MKIRPMQPREAALAFTEALDFLAYHDSDYSACDYAALQMKGRKPWLELCLRVPRRSGVDAMTSTIDKSSLPIVLSCRISEAVRSADPKRSTAAAAFQALGVAILSIDLPVLSAGGRYLNALPSKDTALFVDAACDPEDVASQGLFLVSQPGARVSNRDVDIYMIPSPVRSERGVEYPYTVQYGLNTSSAVVMRPREWC